MNGEWAKGFDLNVLKCIHKFTFQFKADGKFWVVEVLIDQDLNFRDSGALVVPRDEHLSRNSSSVRLN